MARPFRNRGNGYLIISINYTIIIYNLSKGKMEGWKRFFALWTFGYIQFMKREFLLLFVDDSISCSFIIFSARNEMASFLEAVDKIVSILERWIFNICNVLFISIFQNISFSSSDLLSLSVLSTVFQYFPKIFYEIFSSNFVPFYSNSRNRFPILRKVPYYHFSFQKFSSLLTPFRLCIQSNFTIEKSI